MIRATFEILPDGSEERKVRAATLEVKNEHIDTESGLASYTYSLWDGSGRREGAIDDWPRNERTVVQLAYACLQRSGIGNEIGLYEMVRTGPVAVDDAGEPI